MEIRQEASGNQSDTDALTAQRVWLTRLQAEEKELEVAGGRCFRLLGTPKCAGRSGPL